MTETQNNDSRQKYLRQEYIARINRVIDYVEANIDKNLSLASLAKVANFSQFHFHRIFRAMVGETLNGFIQRIRLEKAAARLLDHPKESITEIAFEYGFSGSATFARAFRERYQMSASEWRSDWLTKKSKNRKTNSKNGQTIGKNRKDFDGSSYYIDDQTQNLIWRIKMKNSEQIKVEVKEMPELNVAYVHHIGPYKGDSELFEGLFDKLMKWAGPRGLLRFPETQVLSVYHDDPKITDEDKLRTSACITVHKDTPNETALIDVNEGNVSDTGFFCYMSKRKSQGYRRKLDWLRLRFSEGMKIKVLGQGQRGFIEYIPGEYAWRSVNADGFMMIHCLWVVGKSKGKGYGSLLLKACLKDAKKIGMKGVAAVTSQGNWLIGKKILKKHGFESVGQAPPSFELIVKPFGKVPLPSFTDHWDTKARQYGKGLTIIRSDQCPYLDDATQIALETVKELGFRGRVVELKDCRQVRAQAPSAYGVFSLVYNGKLLSYHYLTKKELIKKLEALK